MSCRLAMPSTNPLVVERFLPTRTGRPDCREGTGTKADQGPGSSPLLPCGPSTHCAVASSMLALPSSDGSSVTKKHHIQEVLVCSKSHVVMSHWSWPAKSGQKMLLCGALARHSERTAYDPHFVEKRLPSLTTAHIATLGKIKVCTTF